MRAMKKNVKAYLFKRFKKVIKDEDLPYDQPKMLDSWPDLRLCVELYYKTSPAMQQYHHTARQPIEFDYTEKFSKSLDKHCTTKILKLRLIDALTKIVYKIPSGGLRDAPIKERINLRHFYVSDSWRVFYRKNNNYILLVEFCPHKKLLYSRRY